ncbi:hypothetical protein OG921_01340 [Aldersonia sp. NBC_00410]|uniref:hypothetical protein n=1 Tax=Aldersonia sp. NBC_00410 TaxID=2975954 RepID=UPI002255FCAF|nr:hypothetical protein [Aldersonia sp. NBC_00410]MCX5041836.1 hypothetical protein [Aldersonia sp. NBC_00410]
MSLNIFAGWAGYLLALVAVISLAGFLVAAGYGFTGWAVISGICFVGAVLLGVAIVGGTVRHDHRLHQDTPHMF